MGVLSPFTVDGCEADFRERQDVKAFTTTPPAMVYPASAGEGQVTKAMMRRGRA